MVPMFFFRIVASHGKIYDPTRHIQVCTRTIEKRLELNTKSHKFRGECLVPKSVFSTYSVQVFNER